MAFDQELVGTNQDDTILGGMGKDKITGKKGDDILYGEEDDDTLIGSKGNDRLYGGAGIDTLKGGSGHDTLYGGLGADDLIGGGGIDTLYGEDGNDKLNGGSGNDRLEGGSGNDNLIGGNNNDYLLGGSGADTLNGGRHNDILDGGAGNDTIKDTRGHDVFLASAGDDKITDQAAAIDTETVTDNQDTTQSFNFYINSTSIENLNLSIIADFKLNVTDTTGVNGFDKVRNVQFYKFGSEIYTWSNLAKLLGEDIDNATMEAEIANLTTIEGFLTQEQRDLLDLANSTIVSSVVSNPAQEGSYTDDNLVGDSNDNVLAGKAGDDMLIGNGGQDTFYGGAGIDTVSFAAAIGGIDLTLQGNWIRDDGFGNGEIILDVENIIGSNYQDNIIGSAVDNVLTGNAGDDYLFGNAGNDILSGGAGVDRYDGGAGSDRVIFTDATEAVQVSLNSSYVTNDGHGNGEAILNVEEIEGGNFNDSLTGSAGNNRLYGHDGDDQLDGRDGDDYLQGGAGVDLIRGGAGEDMISFQTATGGVDVTLTAQYVRVDGHGNAEKIYDIEHIEGGNFTDLLYGDANDNKLYGMGGYDKLEGRGGNDLLVGGASYDKLYGGAGNDTFAFTDVYYTRDFIYDFTISGAEQDYLNITDILEGYDPLSDVISDFLRLDVIDSNIANLRVNADGEAGDDYIMIASFRNTDFTGMDAQDLFDNGNIITDQSVLL